jgi:hypothetical protein
MKKSWHPQLLVNQERVWLKEKEAVRNVLPVQYEVMLTIF